MITETCIDSAGGEFNVGDRVVNLRNMNGTVIHVSDPDGDLDDDGRPIHIAPRATVRFDDGSEEDYVSFWTACGPRDNAPWQFDDIELVKGAR